MIRGLTYAALLLISLVSAGMAQDIHFSQFMRNPLVLNPGHTGNFEGTWRLAANYRTQWFTVTRPYNTTTLSAEYNGLSPIGMGIQLMQDASGDGDLTQSGVQVPISYRLPLNKGILRPAINIGFRSVSLDWNALRFDDQFNGIRFDPNLATGEVPVNTGASYVSVGTGVVYSLLTDKGKAELGYSVNHLNNPSWSVIGGDVSVRALHQFFAFYRHELTESIYLEGTGLYRMQGTHAELLFGADAGFILDDRYFNYRAVIGGFRFRGNDAAAIFGGIDYNTWRFGVSYDFNVSDLNVSSRYQGAAEFSLIYRIPIKTTICPPGFKPFCPDYL